MGSDTAANKKSFAAIVAAIQHNLRVEPFAIEHVLKDDLQSLREFFVLTDDSSKNGPPVTDFFGPRETRRKFAPWFVKLSLALQEGESRSRLDGVTNIRKRIEELSGKGKTKAPIGEADKKTRHGFMIKDRPAATKNQVGKPKKTRRRPRSHKPSNIPPSISATADLPPTSLAYDPDEHSAHEVEQSSPRLQRSTADSLDLGIAIMAEESPKPLDDVHHGVPQRVLYLLLQETPQMSEVIASVAETCYFTRKERAILYQEFCQNTGSQLKSRKNEDFDSEAHQGDEVHYLFFPRSSRVYWLSVCRNHIEDKLSHLSTYSGDPIGNMAEEQKTQQVAAILQEFKRQEQEDTYQNEIDSTPPSSSESEED